MFLLTLLILIVACRPSSPTTTDLLQQHLAAGRPAQAHYHLEIIAQDTGWTPQLHLQAADIALMMNQVRRALTHWEAVASPSQELLQRMAEAYLALGDWANAQTTLEQLATLDPHNADIHYQLGLLRAPFDPSGAIADFEIAVSDALYATQSRVLIDTLQTHRADPLVSMYVGLSLANLNIWDHAERAFRYAALIQHPYPEALAYTALARRNQGEDGREWIEQALDLAPENPRVQFVNGVYLREIGAFDASVQAFVNAVALEPNNPTFAVELGTAYQLDDQFARAEYWLRTAVTLSRGDPLYQQILAQFYVDAGFTPTQSRVDVLRLAVEARPTDPALRAALGWALYTDDERDAGIREADLALELAPTDPYALYYRGLIAVEQGDTEFALTLFDQVVESDSPLAYEVASLLAALRAE